jgi:hypothetical protein
MALAVLRSFALQQTGSRPAISPDHLFMLLLILQPGSRKRPAFICQIAVQKKIRFIFFCYSALMVKHWVSQVFKKTLYPAKKANQAGRGVLSLPPDRL